MSREADACPSTVLLIQEFIPPYRVPIFDLLADAEQWLLVVAHAQDRPAATMSRAVSDSYAVRRGKIFVRAGVSELLERHRPDVVVAMFNLRWLDLLTLATVRRRRYGLVFWGIGMSSARGYRRRLFMDRVRRTIARRADALVLYSDGARSIYPQAAMRRTAVFVAENTVHVPEPAPLGATGTQSSILFLGTLREDKGVGELVRAFAMARSSFARRITLDVVGDGPDRVNIEHLAADLGILEDVLFHGVIHDVREQRVFFARAVACVSPRQAGLSVLSSMAHGVPFVTHSDAITGGERLNIRPGINGVLYDKDASELAARLVELVNDERYARSIGRAAYEHYLAHATSENMVRQLREAILHAARSHAREKRA